MHITDEKIYEFLDNEIKPEEIKAFKEHIVLCEECNQRYHELKNLENEYRKKIPSDNEIELLKNAIRSNIEENINKKETFFTKTFVIPFSGLATTAAAFVMIMIGTIIALSPNNREVETIVPGANSNISMENIYKVADEKELTIDDHIKAIEDMGYSVILEPIKP